VEGHGTIYGGDYRRLGENRERKTQVNSVGGLKKRAALCWKEEKLEKGKRSGRKKVL